MKGKLRFLEQLDLMDEPIPGHPLVELCGHTRVLIEEHNGVMEYGPELIAVKVRFGSVRIHGCGLEICRMRSKQLIIIGTIHSISLEVK